MEKIVADIMKRITLKKVKTFEGQEGVGLNAEVYFDKVNIAFALDSGDGGEMDFQVRNKEKFKELETLIEALPVIELFPESTLTFNGKAIEGKPDLAWMIDYILVEKEVEKLKIKLEKEFLTKICFGVPNGTSYGLYNLKKPLMLFSKQSLQTFIDTTVKPKLKEGEVILNTNLESMGIKI